jgi:beta-glucanase (GH16 family)
MSRRIHKSPLHKAALALGVLAVCAAATSAAPADAAAAPPPGSWRLIFNEEFKGTTLNTSRWSTRYLDRGNGDLQFSNRPNGEHQWYKRRNVKVGGGLLKLVALRERTVSPYSGRVFNYSSGMITSKPSLNFLYGYMEARVKFPKGSGLWPAFWTWSSDPAFATPEIDVAEFFGDNPRRLYLIYHLMAGGAAAKILTATDWTAKWHTVGVDWAPGRQTWYVDGVRRWTVSDNANRPMYLVTNLAIAGSRIAPPPNKATRFPASYLVDHIRVWKRR